jgi:hypothetical protein
VHYGGKSPDITAEVAEIQIHAAILNDFTALGISKTEAID